MTDEVNRPEEASASEFPSFDLSGKKALVTGATKGLGRDAAVAETFSDCDVI